MEVTHKFFKCNLCGNLVVPVVDMGTQLVCCGQDMNRLEPNTTEASTEKHLPSVTASADSVSVQVGSAAHPMEDGHHIEFVYVKTEEGGQRKHLNIGEEPKCVFSFSDDKPIAVYAYCNLHGLWVTEV